MQVTEKWLGEIGGWQAMKAARDFVRLGSVAEVSTADGTYKGLVGSGQRKFRATLVTGPGTRAEAKCGCPDAQRGLICAHALAVALAAISPPPAPAAPSAATGSRERAGQGNMAVKTATSEPPKPRFREEDIPTGEFTIYIATEQLAPSGSRGTATGSVPVFLKFQAGPEGRETGVGGWLLQQGMKVQTMPLRLPAVNLGSLLDALVDHPRVHQGLPKNINNSEKSTRADNLLIERSIQIKTRSSIDNNDQCIDFQSVSDDWVPVGPQGGAWLFSAKRGAFASVAQDLPPAVLVFLATLMQRGKVRQPLRWVIEHLPSLRHVLQAEAPDDALLQLKVLPARPVFRLRLEGNLRRVEATLAPLLPDGTSEASHASYPIQDVENRMLFYSWNANAEGAATRRLEDAGFRADGRSVFELKGEREVLRLLSSDLPRLKREFKVVEGEGWRAATRGLAIIRPKVRPPTAAESQPGAASMDWLSLEVAYEAADGFSIPRSEVLRLIRGGKRDLTGKNGRRYLLDSDGCEELEEVVQDMESHFEAGNRLAVRSRQAEVLEGFVDRPEVLALHLCPLLDPPVLKGMLGSLGGMLRPYQLEGVRWMERHSRTKGGGILADEMGLGKTVQTLALLRALKAGTKTSTGPALIICPTSLLGNWFEEAARFAPELKGHISHESDRHESLNRMSDFDVIFTSYALIVRDLQYYEKQMFSAVVLDEASYIRNPDTATAKAVRRLRADCRFALTGTPVENSVRDLWSIFEFLVPRQLPPRDDFQERFVKPLSQVDSAQAKPVMERLRRLIRPNILRRTKREVAKDLPEKIEKVLWCELSAPQKEIYQRLLDEGREEIRQARRRAGQGSARMTMFTVLLRLRQICNDVRLAGVKGIDGISHAENSGKWPVLDELLLETLEGGHKALIFSQFVGMLRLVKAKVEGLGTTHSYLDGSTKDRAAQVAAFQNDPERRLFLISLKAGGYGLNLTAADEVVLIDPWWNPAVEAQAIDRAHRIGQGRPVTAYRLVTRGTVEEKILKLQSQKRAIMDMTLDDDPTVMAGVTDEELEAMVMG